VERVVDDDRHTFSRGALMSRFTSLTTLSALSSAGAASPKNPVIAASVPSSATA